MDVPEQSAAPRILIVRVGAMGDVLHALPAAALLRASLPGAVLGWAVEPRWAALLQAGPAAAPRSAAMPLLDRVHAVPTRLWSRQPLSATTLRSVLALRKELRAARYHLALDLQGSVRSAVIARMSGAQLVVGPAAPRETPARWLYRTRVPARATHVIDQGLELAAAALASLLHMGAIPDMHAEHATGPVPLPLDPLAEAWAHAACGVEPFVLLAPTAGWGAKQWPAERFGALAAATAQHGLHVLVNSLPGVDTTAAAVLHHAQSQLPAALHGRVRPVIADLAQLVAVVRRARAVVAGDTGPLHLAAALGVPVVALFGPTDPARNGPYSNDATVLRDPESTTDHRRHRETEAGLRRIPVERVLQALLALLERPR